VSHFYYRLYIGAYGAASVVPRRRATATAPSGASCRKRHKCQRAKKPVETTGKTSQFVVFCPVNEHKTRRHNGMEKIEPQSAYFIKLGLGGQWEKSCIENGTIHLGFDKTDHAACLAGNWEKIRNDELKNGRAKGTATVITNEIKHFYEEPEETLWITFYANRMWWCFAKREVEQLQDGSKIRNVIDQWRDTDIHDRPLSFEKISGRLLKVKGFQGTICSVDCAYVSNKINAITSKEVTQSKNCIVALRLSLIPLIQNLTWKDFELLVDLVFSNAGWQRVSVLGKTEKNIDLDLLSPVTGERVMVQIKAASDKKEFEYYCQEFDQTKDFVRFFYVVHTPLKSLLNAKVPSRTQLVFAEQLVELVINAGLVEWLIKKNE
jgi:hypothetical protein